MNTQALPRYVYSRDRDGCDDTFDVWDTQTSKAVTSIPFWDCIEGDEEAAELEALLLTENLNVHGPRHVRAFDDIA
jgi:hypothetical protein